MDVDTAVEGVLDARKKITAVFDSPDALSKEASRLATYNAYIGDFIGDLEAAIADETATKHLQYLEEGLSDNAAEKRIKAELAKDIAQKKKLKIMHTDAGNQISIVQSRLKVLNEQARNNS